MSKTDALYEKLLTDGHKHGYYLGKGEFARDLVTSLLTNEERYGYQACPCRLAAGKREEDLDIICPCDYRDQDITEYGACYCGLYVSRDVSQGIRELKPIPERRLNNERREEMKIENSKSKTENSGLPVWRCQVCGYLCAREDAPDICPICGVAHDRFERFEQ
jgi:ferredoxin-thioredoxin reductase catalytic subunit